MGMVGLQVISLLWCHADAISLSSAIYKFARKAVPAVIGTFLGSCMQATECNTPACHYFQATQPGVSSSGPDLHRSIDLLDFNHNGGAQRDA